MAKKKAALAGRAWNRLRLALFWERKGGVFRRGLAAELRFVPNYLKSLRAGPSDRVHYREREFSFDETPIFRFKMHRRRSMMRLPRIPCINPPVDFDDGGVICYSHDRSNANEEDYATDGDGGDELRHEEVGREEEGGRGEEEGIDSKAEEFIAKFYEQMKLQRQVSFLRYNEMLLRSSS